MQEEHSLADLYAALAVSRSGYHGWTARAPGPRAQANAVLWQLIEPAYEESRQTYGSPRIQQWLERRGQKGSRHRVARLMRSHRLASQVKRRFRLALAALDMALKHRRPAEGLGHHSDRGVQYASAGHGWRAAQPESQKATATTTRPWKASGAA